jgi:hypothetical protein
MNRIAGKRQEGRLGTSCVNVDEGINSPRRAEPMKILIRRHHGTIYPERGGYTGVIDLGYDGRGNRIRIKKKDRTKQDVKERLIKAVDDLEGGIDTSDSYTVVAAVRDWLEKGTRGLGDSTIGTYRILIDKHLIPQIGVHKLKKLTADQVDEWLEALTSELLTATLHKLHSALKRAIHQAQARDKVGRNVADLATTPRGREGRPSKALTLDQAIDVPAQARSHWLYAYVALSLLTGVRTEEARALQWSHIVAWSKTHADGSQSPKRASTMTSSRSMSGARFAPEETPRPQNPAAPWKSPTK